MFYSISQDIWILKKDLNKVHTYPYIPVSVYSNRYKPKCNINYYYTKFVSNTVFYVVF